MTSQGASAVTSGQTLETLTEKLLMGMDFVVEKQVRFTDCYGNNRSKMDFFIPELNCAIECKNQNVSGTADQKLPFVHENLKLFPATKGLLVLSGEHYKGKTGIKQYLDSKKSDWFDWVFVEELEEWIIEQTI